MTFHQQALKLFCIALLLTSTIACAQRTATKKSLPTPTNTDLVTQIANSLIPRIQVENEPTYYQLEERMKHFNVPGFSMAVIKNGRIESARGFGHARKEEGIKMDATSILHAGSISKSITALLVMKLQEQGVLDIDTDIRKYLKTWELPKNEISSQAITLRTLLNHTSGLKEQQRMKKKEDGYHQDVTSPNLNEILDGKTVLQKVAFDTAPGEVYKYSNQGYNIIQKVIEDVTGESFETLCQSLVLDPLQMTASTFKTVRPNKQNTNYAYAYYEGKAVDGYWHNHVEKSSGGLLSTPSDLAKVLNAVRQSIQTEKGFLSPKSMQEIMTSGEHYGLGFEVLNIDSTFAYWHSGRTYGYFSFMLMYPETGDGFVMMTNSEDANDLFSEVLRGASHVLQWHKFAKPKTITAIPTSIKALKQYEGSYFCKDGEDEYQIDIVIKNNQLYYIEYDEDEKYEYEMRKIDEYTFMDIVEGYPLEFAQEEGKLNYFIYDDEYKFVKRLND